MTARATTTRTRQKAQNVPFTACGPEQKTTNYLIEVDVLHDVGVMPKSEVNNGVKTVQKLHSREKKSKRALHLLRHFGNSYFGHFGTKSAGKTILRDYGHFIYFATSEIPISGLQQLR